MWETPLLPYGKLFFDNLNKSIDLPSLRFSVLDASIILLLGLAIIRRNRIVDRVGRVGNPSILNTALFITIAGILVMEAWGLLRDGDFKNSLWQIRVPLFTPVLALMFLATLRGPKDFSAIGALVIAAACWKSLLGIYFYEIICRPLNVQPPYVTSHSDSVLFVTAIVITLALWHEKRNFQSLMLVLIALPIICLGMIINNRRLVYVELAFSIIVTGFIVPWTPVKRLAVRAILIILPFMPVYIAAGWNSNSAIFGPARTFQSVISSDSDRSTATRDIENFNLIFTLKSSPLLGVGFGHEYFELVRADDISYIFPQYRYLPHNSLLGIWAFGGLVGFCAIWFSLAVGAYLSVRSFSLAKRPEDRTAALVCVSVFITYSLQAYGDIGYQCWSCAAFLAMALAVSGKLAMAVGAWPSLRKRRSQKVPTLVLPKEDMA
jgi:hypothetical protein